ncbi:hypothetical protein V9T40_010124 [Parthenolecanium corni]|uniref:Kinesin-like protein n=1 Tax=Parthenolecanium corni TaxID=536013 RepID=A0AAN9TLQ7_9HEMI
MTSIDVALFDGISLKSPLDDFKSLNGFGSPTCDDTLRESTVSRVARSASKARRSESAKKQECVTVVVRCRPMSPKEKLMGYQQVVEMWTDQGTVLIRNPKENHKDPVKTFTFDAVYDWSSTQQDLFDETVRPLIESVLNGFNATIFAYGQTGTGKTYTMEGCKLAPTDGADERGVIPKSFEQIFTHISRTTNKQHLVRASYLEIYQEEIRDLLDKDPKKRYELKESKEIGVYVKGLRSFVCKSVKEIEHVMNVGNRNRTIGATDMNEHSSRSHAIFMITVEMSDLNGAKGQVRVGKLNLVDLAGSERQAKTGATGDRLKEASKINLSLSALGNVISALVDEKCQYIPYRDSKLTRLLQDSLGGNSKTLMVANIGPASYNYDESLTTLRYANRAKNIQNQPRINEDPKDALIRQYQEEIERLKILLVERTHKSHPVTTGEDLSWEQQNEYYNREAEELEQQKANILMGEDQSEEEKAKELQALEEKRRLVESERKYAMELNEKIHSMESKLLQGGKNIIDHTNEQQKALEKRMAEIRERKHQSLQMQKRLEEVEESAESIRLSYSNLLEEVEAKKKQLSKIVAKCQRVKQEISDSIEEHGQFRRDLELSQKNLMKEIKLDRLIIDNFVPLEERKNVEERLVYDDNEKSWRVLPDDNISYSIGRLVANPGYRRPTCEYTKELLNAREFHVGGENILLLELDPLPRTTKEYEGSAIPSSLKLMLQSALKEEDDIEIDAAPSRSSSRVRDRSRGTSVVRGASGIVRNGKYYPQSRGLVSK